MTAINVNGGDPTASDTAVVNGTVGADAIEYSPIGADSGTVQVNAAPVVNLATVEHLTINGLGGNDALTVNVLAGPMSHSTRLARFWIRAPSFQAARYRSISKTLDPPAL